MSRWSLKERFTKAPAPKKTATIKDGRVVGSNRDWKLLIFFCLVAVVLVAQLVHLQVFAAPSLRAEAKAQRSNEVTIHAKRGTIYDRNGNVLAMSVDATTIYANPKEVTNPKGTADLLASVLGGSADDYYQDLTQDTTFVYIMQQADTTLAQTLMDKETELEDQGNDTSTATAAASSSAADAGSTASGSTDASSTGSAAATTGDATTGDTTSTATDGTPAASTGDTTTSASTSATSSTDASTNLLTGIYYLKDTKRVYPYGNIGAQVIGGVNIDNQGAYGLELMYDNILKGTDGTVNTEYSLDMGNRPLSGQPIPGSDVQEVAPIPGNDIVVSLDIDLQQQVETQMAQVGQDRQTDKGSVLLLDGGTGEIYASASLPLMDRDNLTQDMVDNGALSLGSICTVYEPGSIFKAVTAAALLEENAMSPDDQIQVPGYRDYPDGDTTYTVTDAWQHDEQTMSLTDIITQSSNIGMTLAGDRLSNDTFYSYLQKFGFGQATHVDYPGEGIGLLDTPDNWSDLEKGNITFGQGISTTPLAMASFYGAIVNNGVKCQPHFLIDQPASMADLSVLDQSTQIMSSHTADQLTTMLESVVANGTGKTAAIDGYTVAGKTGTAQKARAAKDGGGYIPDEYIVSFVGFFANTNSKLVCITSMDNPLGADGNSPTGPLFASIMSFAANRYMILPQTTAQADSQAQDAQTQDAQASTDATSSDTQAASDTTATDTSDTTATDASNQDASTYDSTQDSTANQDNTDTQDQSPTG